MKTAVSIPDPLFESAEQLAARLGITRSRLYQRAIETFLEHHRQMRVSEALDAVYDTQPDGGKLDPLLEKLQEVSIHADEW
jgi:metal-responsive CopG/Arc/MetJ family transcriptional regulator